MPAKTVKKSGSKTKLSAKKPAKSAVAKKPGKTKEKIELKASESVKHSVSLPLFDTDGKTKGNVSVPAELFGVKVNSQLLSQAVRVYLANKREGAASTKTRGEVEGSTRKIYRQKGTGRARHGGIRAPIFVGGGIAFGPKPRDYRLVFPEKMRRAALASALSDAASNQRVAVVDGLSDIKPKTKLMARLLSAMNQGLSVLVVTAGDAANVVKASRNIEGVDTLNARSLNAYEVLSHQKLVMMKEALSEIKTTFVSAK